MSKTARQIDDIGFRLAFGLPLLRLMRNLITLALILTSLTVAADPCDQDLLGELVDPRNVGAVMLGRGTHIHKHVQKEIEAALPAGVKTIHFDFKFSQWVRDWFPIMRMEEGRLVIYLFQPSNPEGFHARNQVLQQLQPLNPKIIDVEVALDVGNFMTDGKRIFIATRPRLRQENYGAFQADPVEFARRIESAFGIPVVTVPALPNELTGHVDVMMQHLGDNRFLVADSRDGVRKLALDKVAEQMRQLGYQVLRVMNAGPDQVSRDTTLTYTNSLIIGNRALVPIYGVMYPALKADDEAALQVYRDAGFEVFPIRMNYMVNDGGMVHCLTRCLTPELSDLLVPDLLL